MTKIKKSSKSRFSLKNSLRKFLAPSDDEPKAEPSEKNKKKKPVENAGRSFFFDLFKWTAFILILPPVVNYANLQRESAEYQSDKFTYDIGFDQKLFMNCSGTGTPTVILDAPAGSVSDVWTLVVEKLRVVTRVCVYDRGGLGRSEMPRPFNMSDPGEATVAKVVGPSFTALRMVHDLHRLLTYSYPQELPFILVGSEIGAVNALAYSKIHPEQIVGLVLIDPFTKSLFEDVDNKKSWRDYWQKNILTRQRLLEIGALSGVNRLAVVLKFLESYAEASSFPPEVISREKHWLCNPRHLSAAYDEYFHLPTSASQLDYILKTASNFTKSVPDVTIVTGNYYDELLPTHLNRPWSKSAQELISAIPGCQHSVINGADRRMIHKLPGEVGSPVLRMLKKWRRKNGAKKDE